MAVAETVIRAYKTGSEGANALARRMGVKQIKTDGSLWKPRHDKVLINWGATTQPAKYNQVITLNPPTFVETATNKFKFLERLANNAASSPFVLPFTADQAKAGEWAAVGKTVVCRTILNGSGGRGIVLAHGANEVVEAPLYVLYKKKKEEFRLHFVGNNLIRVQRKGRRKGLGPVEGDEARIRNVANGYVYCVNDIQLPAAVKQAGQQAHSASGLDFGAYDIIYNEREDSAWVLEVNTAPGLSGGTVIAYADALQIYIDDNFGNEDNNDEDMDLD